MSELRIQVALRSGRTPEQIGEELGIKVFAHPDLPLVGFAYDMIDAPKTHPIVKECRGLVLERDTWNVVAKPFTRFFNVGEDADLFRSFDWSRCTAQSKEDGSLMILYHYAGEWHVNTRGSFGLLPMQNHTRTWREVFWMLLPPSAQAHLIPGRTYLFEMCTVHNKVVRRYSEPSLYLLSAFDNATLGEYGPDASDMTATLLGVKRPEWFEFRSISEVEKFLGEKEAADPTYEGVVLRDATGLRFKAKSKTYLSLHQLHDNGNIAHPRNLVPWCLKDDPSELLSYFPEMAPVFEGVRAKVSESWASLTALWKSHKDIADQKTFALAVKDHPFSSILFTTRKAKGAAQTMDDLRAEWRRDPERIAKRLFGSDAIEIRGAA